jgi:hypothetical protein
MRRLVLSTVLAVGVVLPTAALAFGGGGDGTLSVRNGFGRVTLRFTGSAIGRVAQGSIKVNDPIASDGVGYDFSNCDRETAEFCSGDNIRFRAIGGRYFVSIKGSGISLSAVGRGYATLDGRGDNPNVPHDGLYSVNDAPYKSLPDDEKQIPLVAPSGQ